jgi:hypothetical protein
MNIPEYVAAKLAGASMRYLEEITAHGIYNIDPSISHGDSDDEYDAISAEFYRQSRDMLHEREDNEFSRICRDMLTEAIETGNAGLERIAREQMQYETE